MVNLTQRFHVIGHKRDRDDANFPHVFRSQILQRAVQGRLQPFARSYFALITKPVTVRPATAIHYQAHGVLDLPLVGITLCNHCHGNTVGAKDNFGPRRHRETSEGVINLFHQRVKVPFILVEIFYAVHRDLLIKQPPPLVQAAAGRSRGVLRIQR